MLWQQPTQGGSAGHRRPLGLQPGEFAEAFSIPVDTTNLDEIRLSAAPKELECKVDMANERIIIPPFCDP